MNIKTGGNTVRSRSICCRSVIDLFLGSADPFHYRQGFLGDNLPIINCYPLHSTKGCLEAIAKQSSCPISALDTRFRSSTYRCIYPKGTYLGRLRMHPPRGKSSDGWSRQAGLYPAKLETACPPGCEAKIPILTWFLFCLPHFPCRWIENGAGRILKLARY